MKHVWLIAVLAVAVLATGLTAAASVPRDPDHVLPVDPKVRIGTLDNGLTYYVRENSRPENRVELRLVIDAGSILEDDDQQGLAHFLEHMAFNGTENFAAGELVDYLESIGSRFGPDLNAYTSFDETVYMLEIPTDKEGLLERGILVLRDWASRIILDPAEVDKERGVVLDEWRQGLGAQERLRKVHWPVLFRDSRYADRLPIGLPEIIEDAPTERIADYYRRWYRPDLMAIVAVGTLDADALEELIRKTFSDLEVREDSGPRPTFDVPSHEEALASVGTDPEQTVSQVWVAFKHPVHEPGTVAAYRRTIARTLFTQMLNVRLVEVSKKPDPPFQTGFASAGGVVRGTDMASVFAVTKEGETEQGLDALLTEIARARIHGFQEPELNRAKSQLEAAFERAYNERNKTENSVFVSEYTRSFLEGEPIPGVEYEFALLKDLLPAIDLAEINAMTAEFFPARDMVVILSVPEKEGQTLPEADALIALAKESLASEPGPYEDELEQTTLLTELPEPRAVVEREELPDLGITVIRLENGVEAWLKPTDFKNDQVLFSGISLGGTSLADLDAYRSASAAAQIVAEGGLGGLTPVEIQKILAGKIVSVSPFFQSFAHGVQGGCAPKDMEELFQATHLLFTSPNRRPESFEVLRDRFLTLVQNRDQNPETQYRDRVSILNHSNHYMYQPWNEERVRELDLDEALKFYKERFADASDFRFFLVGAFEVEAVVPLLERYVGSLPSRRDGPSVYGDTDIVFPSGVIEETVRAGREPKSQTRITWPARTSMDEMEMFTMRMATDILEIRLRDVLREELGNTYSVVVGYSYTPPYPKFSTTSISFGSAPKNVEPMVDTVLEEIARFKTEGPTAEEIAKVGELERRAVEKGYRENGYWLGSLQSLHILGWEPERILARLDRIDELDARIMKQTFSMYFPDGNYTVVSLKPREGNP